MPPLGQVLQERALMLVTASQNSTAQGLRALAAYFGWKSQQGERHGGALTASAALALAAAHASTSPLTTERRFGRPPVVDREEIAPSLEQSALLKRHARLDMRLYEFAVRLADEQYRCSRVTVEPRSTSRQLTLTPT